MMFHSKSNTIHSNKCSHYACMLFRDDLQYLTVQIEQGKTFRNYFISCQFQQTNHLTQTTEYFGINPLNSVWYQINRLSLFVAVTALFGSFNIPYSLRDSLHNSYCINAVCVKFTRLKFLLFASFSYGYVWGSLLVHINSMSTYVYTFQMTQQIPIMFLLLPFCCV